VTSMMQLELMARALRLCKENALPEARFAAEMGGNHGKTVDLARELQTRRAKRQDKGRRQYLLRTTPLGEEFIQQYSQLLNMRLHVSDNDIKKALHQADQARRLIEKGISPFVRFQEVNELTRNIAASGKAGGIGRSRRG
jgi:predicted transcriptional regulator